MTKYREILRLHNQGLSGRIIAESLKCSRNTIKRVLERAKERSLSWPLADDVSDSLLEQKLFGKQERTQRCKMPDYDYVHQEMAKSGVTLTLLWSEYCESCKLESSRPLMYSQFCFHYHEYAAKTKATLRIHYKPGDRMEVDAGKKIGILVILHLSRVTSQENRYQFMCLPLFCHTAGTHMLRASFPATLRAGLKPM